MELYVTINLTLTVWHSVALLGLHCEKAPDWEQRSKVVGSFPQAAQASNF